MGEHAKLAPSAAHRWLKCPGSVNLCEGIPSPETFYSREGTFAHEVAARQLADGGSAALSIGLRSDSRPDAICCDAQMAKHLQRYLDVVRWIVLLEDGELLIEQGVTINDHIWGTADAVVWSGDGKRLHIVDLKYGSGVLVSPFENEQEMLYAIGALRSVPTERAKRIEAVHLHIVQPRRPDADDNPHREWVTDLDQLQTFWEEVRRVAPIAVAPGAPLMTGDHCQFCPARGVCPQLHAGALEMAKTVFPAGVEAPPAPPAPEMLSDDQLSKMLSMADTVEIWLRAIREHATERLQQRHIPGWKLVQRIGNRRWIDEQVAASALQQAGIDPYAPRELLSPAKAEKALGARLGPAVVAPLTTRPATGVVLVPETDSRPALLPSAQVFLDSPPAEE